jgi:hypothetical protein
MVLWPHMIDGCSNLFKTLIGVSLTYITSWVPVRCYGSLKFLFLSHVYIMVFYKLQKRNNHLLSIMYKKKQPYLIIDYWLKFNINPHILEISSSNFPYAFHFRFFLHAHMAMLSLRLGHYASPHSYDSLVSLSIHNPKQTSCVGLETHMNTSLKELL